LLASTQHNAATTTSNHTRSQPIAQQSLVYCAAYLDDERKQIIDEGVQRLVGKHTPWQVRDGFEFVVDEQLRRHHDEAERIHRTCQTRQYPRVPTLVCL
jgi:hypothetical protein